MNKVLLLVLALFGIVQAAIYQATDDATAVTLTTSAIKVVVKKVPFQLAVYDIGGKLLTSQAPGSVEFAPTKIKDVVSHAPAGTTPIVKRSPARYHAEDEAVITGESHKFNCSSTGSPAVTVYITFRSPSVFSFFLHSPDAGNKATKEVFLSAADEHFWGLGETWDVHALDLKGHSLTMANRTGTPDQGGYIPFYISSRGYGILIDNYLAVKFDFGSNTTVTMPAIAGSTDGDGYAKGASVNWWFYYGPDMLDVIDKYTEHVSRPALPPPWAVFATWQWRDAIKESDVYKDAKGMRAAGIPMGLTWIDRPWATGNHGGEGMPPPFKWNSTFPNGTKMFADLQAMGIKTGVWVAENAYAGVYDPKKYMGSGEVNKLKSDASSWLKENNAQMYKIDRGNLQNFAPYFSIQAFYEAWYSVFEDDFVTLPRTVSHRGQKYISGKWPGDNDNAFGYGSGGLASNIPAMLNFGITGFPHWGSDVGGFPDPPGNDVTIRWAEFSALGSIFQTASTPYTFSSENKAIYKKYAMLYTSLFPYRWTYTVLASTKGHPTTRALALHFPDDAKVYNQDAEFLLGDWLLAAPIVVKANSRSVYLPEGEWIDWWTGARHPGKTTITANAPLDVLPLYMRAGAIIPMIEVTDTKNQTWLKSEMNPLIVRVCPAGKTTFSLAGDKKVYKNNSAPYTNLDPAEFVSEDLANGVAITVKGAATTQYHYEVYTKKTFLSVTNNGVALTRVASNAALAAAASGWSQEAGKPAFVKVPAGAAINVVGMSVNGEPVNVDKLPPSVNSGAFSIAHNQRTGNCNLTFSLDKHSAVSVVVYQANGHQVKTLLSRSMNAGFHSIELSAGGLAPGCYLVSLTAGKTIQKEKLMIVK